MVGVQRRIGQIRVAVRAPQTAVEQHALYPALTSISALRVFMEHHVFAVWDFMSLLKALQIELTCTTVPWRPVGDADVRRFINDIVHCEESDRLANGRSMSHLELYIEAMRSVGANTQPIERFLVALEDGQSVEEALKDCDAPEGSRAFVLETFRIIESGNVAAIAAAFTFGREQALPSIFHQLVRRLERNERADLSPLVTYLDRHIEVDGGDHGWLAEKLLAACCGESDAAWSKAEEGAILSLQARQRLWDDVLTQSKSAPPDRPLLDADRRNSKDPRETFWTRVILIVSAVVCGAVAFLIYGPRPEALAGKLDVSALPFVNASLNSLTLVLLIWGVTEIKRGALIRHQRLMLSAFGSSALFLVTYVVYHWFKAGPKVYDGDFRSLYLFILLSHIVLAVLILPMALTTLYRGWVMDRARHRALARWTFPVWVYVSVTGVVIYWMAHT